jgi:hypothetical protein
MINRVYGIKTIEMESMWNNAPDQNGDKGN